MSEDIYTAEQCAERLKLHPKTVRRFIREGRLRAVKVGKSYRVLRSDLEALTGALRGPVARPHGARVTSIVDVPDVDPERAQRLARILPALRMGREAPADPMSLDVAHDPADARLKIVMVGSPEDTCAALKVVQAVLEARA